MISIILYIYSSAKPSDILHPRLRVKTLIDAGALEVPGKRCMCQSVRWKVTKRGEYLQRLHVNIRVVTILLKFQGCFEENSLVSVHCVPPGLNYLLTIRLRNIDLTTSSFEQVLASRFCSLLTLVSESIELHAILSKCCKENFQDVMTTEDVECSSKSCYQ